MKANEALQDRQGTLPDSQQCSSAPSISASAPLWCIRAFALTFDSSELLSPATLAHHAMTVVSSRCPAGSTSRL